MPPLWNRIIFIVLVSVCGRLECFWVSVLPRRLTNKVRFHTSRVTALIRYIRDERRDIYTLPEALVGLYVVEFCFELTCVCDFGCLFSNDLS